LLSRSFTPWTAVNLVDFYFVRKTHCSVREILNPRGLYGRWNARATGILTGMEGSAGWTDFLVASAGATGALAGLVFVALSINLARILELPGVVWRGGETILLLAAGLMGSLIALVPGLPTPELAVLLLVLWLPTWGVPTVIQIQAIRRKQYYRAHFALLRFVLHQAATLPFLFAALSLERLMPGGLYWLAAALLMCLAVGMLNAWVLLVEIVR
jgi:hypothetical protein